MKKGVVLSIAALAAFWLVCCVMLFLPGSYTTSGNLHDVFIPYWSSMAIERGMVLHQDVHSPFGWIYFWMNYAASLLIQHSFFSFNDLIPLGSLLWAIFIVFVWFGVSTWGGVPHRQNMSTQVFFAIFLALIVFNFRGGRGLSYQVNTWYGAYNNQLWGVIFLQLALVCTHCVRDIGLKSVRLLGVVQAISVYVCIHYKISFGLASIILSFIPISFAWVRCLKRNYIVSLLLCCAVLVILTALSGYSYKGYLNDIAGALGAKSANAASIDHDVTLLAVLVALSGILCVMQEGQRISVNVSQWCMICLAFYLCVAGDFATPVINYACVFGVVALLSPIAIRRFKLVKFLAICGAGGMAASIVINLLSIGYIAASKVHWVTLNFMEDFHIETPYGEMAWRARQARIFESQFDYFSQSEALFDPLERRVMWAYPGIEKLNKRYVSASIADYIDGLKMVRERFVSHQSVEQRSVIYLEFINPLPILIGSDIVKGAPHWVHFGTTTPYSANDHLIHQMIMSSNEVVIPLASPDNWRQPFLNCKFLLWNEKEKQGFVLTDTDSHHLYYQRRADAGGVSPHPMLARALENCRGVVAAGAAGRLGWPLR
jgi:hypothetical protein